ncbi:17627_t:CDS:2 [Funneliformis caledonium]|uniref:17627_t:CDS:1 n=2 Tax=Funneliformis TaxID=1117308 RepID=A0A9N8ZN09_9GLOM|nr:17627_t:CDS:2 [Funneliformis caledonium]CAG8555205.1 2139_t:CDS:2 [Funneliformis mosseae]
MNTEQAAAAYFNQTGAFVQAQPQQQSTPQPIRLAHPTTYHLQQTQLRNQKQITSDGAPPTPNNSYQSKNTLSNNSFSKTDSPDLSQEMDFDNSNTVMSPISNTPSLGSPPTHPDAFDPDDFGRSYKPTSHLESGSPFGESPGNASIYSYGADNLDYSYLEEFSPMSAPTTTSAIGPMDVKSNMNNSNTKFFRHPHNSFGAQISMSLPVQLGNEWFGSLDTNNFQPGAHPSSLQYPATGENMQLMASGYLDSDENDSAQKQALLYEKRRRRRESHNAVERRRRDNINEKIQELSTLLPDLYIDSANKPNKGVILRKSVDYIRHLKQLVEQHKNRNVELESRVRELSSSGIPIDSNSGSTSSRMDLNNSSSIGGLSGSPHNMS